MVEPCLSKAGPTVKLTVVNTSETYQIFQSISCSWQDFWRTDDRNALLIGQSECAKNSLCTVVLAPGEKHAEQTSLLLFYGKPGRRKIRFGYSRRPSDFTSAELKRIHDSNEKFTYFIPHFPRPTLQTRQRDLLEPSNRLRSDKAIDTTLDSA